jgi:hypothetical protein
VGLHKTWEGYYPKGKSQGCFQKTAQCMVDMQKYRIPTQELVIALNIKDNINLYFIDVLGTCSAVPYFSLSLTGLDFCNVFASNSFDFLLLKKHFLLLSVYVPLAFSIIFLFY